MKFTMFLFAVGVMTLVAWTGIYIGGVGKGEYVERNRLYTKCLKEHEALPHKDAVALCEERVK